MVELAPSETATFARGPAALLGDLGMLIRYRIAVGTAVCLLASAVHAENGDAWGLCKSGYSDDTVVRTESRGTITIAEVQVNDRVWSFSELVGKPGWSTVLKRVDGQQQYTLLSDFSEPDSKAVTKACWRIKRKGHSDSK
jgi:hypothetical protein